MAKLGKAEKRKRKIRPPFFELCNECEARSYSAGID
jgi:hypothetical protein